MTGPPLLGRRELLRAGALGVASVALAPVLGACARARPVQAPPAFVDAATRLRARGYRPGLQVFRGGDDLVVGPGRRLALGLATADGRDLAGSARVSLRVAPGDGAYDARWVPFTRPRAEDPPGFWLTEIEVPRARAADIMASAEGDGRWFGFTTFAPLERGVAPAVGAPAPRAHTPTTRDERGVETICTAAPPCPLHRQSLADLLRARRPAVLVVASPLLCTSRTCTPVLAEVVRTARVRSRDAAFVHVEPYASDTTTQLSPAMQAWGLPSEPWAFVIGADGRIRARFEGPVAHEEIDAALDRL